jgi:large subunit ribosomal protein L21
MKQAVIETGGKQYLVRENEKLDIEKISGSAGDGVTFDKVLLLDDNGKVSLGKPYLPKTTVKGRIMEQVKSDKIVVFKYKAKSRYRRKMGHRQKKTRIEIETIG